MPELTMEEFKTMKRQQEQIAMNMLDKQTAAVMQDEAQFKQLLDLLALHVASSVSNTILVQAQRPDATAVASMDEWNKRQIPVPKDANGYYPKGIYQIAYNGQYAGPDGSVHAKFKVYKGFDSSQTADPEKAAAFWNERQPVNVFFDDPEKLRNLALVNASPIKCLAYDPKALIADEENISDGVKYIPETKTVILRKIDRGTWFQQVATQIALGMYHRVDGIEFTVKARMFEAAIVSYLVSCKMGLDTSMYHFNVTPLQQQYNVQEFRQMLEQTDEFARDLSHRVTSKLLAQNVPKSPKQPEPPVIGG